MAYLTGDQFSRVGWNDTQGNYSWPATGAGQQAGYGPYNAGQQMSRR